MIDNSKDNPKDNQDIKKEEIHVCDYTYISSSEGSYNVCRICSNIIQLFGKSY